MHLFVEVPIMLLDTAMDPLLMMELSFTFKFCFLMFIFFNTYLLVDLLEKTISGTNRIKHLKMEIELHWNLTWRQNQLLYTFL